MPRQYTQRAFISGNIANAEDWNAEISTAASELNGQLDQNNMPLGSVTETEVAPATVVVDVNDVAIAHNRIAHTYMQSQSYHTSSSCIVNEVNNSYKTTWSKTDWQLGWMRLAEKRNVTIGGTTYYAGSEVTFEAKEGMLVGECLVDTDWRWSYVAKHVNDPYLATVEIRDENFIEVGVFVNDVCCARTDLQWAGGRFTYVLPFSTPIGTTTAQVDIRFRLNFTNVKLPVGVIIDDNWINPFHVWDSGLWVRNQYR